MNVTADEFRTFLHKLTSLQHFSYTYSYIHRNSKLPTEDDLMPDATVLYLFRRNLQSLTAWTPNWETSHRRPEQP